MRKKHLWVPLFLFLCVAVTPFLFSSSEPTAGFDREQIAATIGLSVSQSEYPTTISMEMGGEAKEFDVTYTFDADLQAHAQELLTRYKPDYGAVVAFDATTGRVLAMADHSVSPDSRAEFGNLALRATYPAASIFKIVTAAAAIEGQKLSPETIIPYNGTNHTLYKRNVANTDVNRFTRYSTIREAFGKSINTVFGKLGLYYVGPESLIQFAHRFQFNHPIKADFPFDSGQTVFSADKEWDVVEAASGFTLNSTLSPVHGALIASSIANNGVMMTPYIVDRIEDRATGSLVYEANATRLSAPLKDSSATQLRVLMQETVERGTSRKSFRQVFGRNMPAEVELGGKTGSLTGKNPNGRVDWFVGYGIWRSHRIGIAAVTVHEKLWRVKSSYVAGSLLQRYFKPRLKHEREVAVIKPERAKTR